jgi:hypothetical protein
MGFAKPSNWRWLRYAVAVLALGLFIVTFPPFHVRSLTSSNGLPAATTGAFDPVEAARTMWEHGFPAAAAQAIDVKVLATALAADPEAAARLGRRTGLGGKYFFFVRGEGRILSIDPEGVRLDIGVSGAEVLLKTGPIFGNALRDASGQFDINAHSSFDANALSTELNRIAEASAQPALLGIAAQAKQLRFTACGEASEANGKVMLKLITISVEPAS